MMKRATGLHCLHVPVSNVEKSVQFYVDRLGFEFARGKENGKYTNALIKIGDSPTIFLNPVGRVENALKFLTEDQNEQAIFEIGTKDIDGFYKRLKDEGVRVNERYDNPGCGKYFEVYDPDGHMICVCQDWNDRFE